MTAQPESSDKLATCDKCHCTSTLSAQFCKISRSDGRRQLLCPACWADSCITAGTSRLKSACLVGIVALVMEEGPIKWFLLQVSLGCVIFHALTPVHELAHAAMAILVGQVVFGIHVGLVGTRILHFSLGRCVIDFRFPLEGGLTVLAQRSERLARFRHALTVAAGPLVHVLLIVLSCRWRLDDSAAWWVPAFVGANVFEVYNSLYPRTFSTPDGPMPNDGLLLLQLLSAPRSHFKTWRISYYYYECLYLLRMETPHRAKEVCLRGLEEFSQDLCLTICRGYCELHLQDWSRAHASFQEAREHANITPETDAFLQNNIAWSNLLTRDPSALKEADEFSARAYAALPWMPPVKGTRGSVLVELGQFSEGIELLSQALRMNEEGYNRAFNAAFLALAHLKLGNTNQAEVFLDVARSHDRTCLLISRVESELYKCKHQRNSGTAEVTLESEVLRESRTDGTRLPHAPSSS